MTNEKTKGLIDLTKVNNSITVIGLGAAGSYIIETLVCMGYNPSLITGYDFDTVEAKNLQNQIYGNPEIGLLKTEALNQVLTNKYGVEINVINEEYVNQELSGIVIMAVDKLFVRKQIAAKAIENFDNIDVVFDVRIGISSFDVFCCEEKLDLEVLIDEMPEDDEVDPSACGTTTLAKPAILMTAGTICMQLTKYLRSKVLLESIGRNNYHINQNLLRNVFSIEG